MTDLVDAAGNVQYGWIKHPVNEINYLDFPLRSVMDTPLSDWRKRLRFNQFNFIGLMSDEVICGIAIVDLKLVSNAFLYVYDFKTGKLREESILQPLGLSTHIGLAPDNYEAKFSQGNKSVRFVHRDPGCTDVEVRIGRSIRINATLTETSHFEPLRICSRAGYDGWVYTQKAAGLEVSGEIEWDGLKSQLLPGKAYGSIDWSAGFMRKDTFWNWACLAGRDDEGRMIGLNLAAGVNETGVTENCLWLDNKLQKVDLAQFEFDRQAPEKEWRVTSSDKRVDLRFVPEGRREEKINAILVASNFKQMFGRFYGTLKCGREKVTVDGIPGFMEDHYARW